MKQFNPEFVAAVGHCYGSSPVLYLSQKGVLDVAAIAHPSFVTEELVAGVGCPMIISTAENDPVFTDELRQQTFGILRENKADYYLQIFSGTRHGFAVRGDPGNSVIEAARNKVFEDQNWFFDKYQAGSSSRG